MTLADHLNDTEVKVRYADKTWGKWLFPDIYRASNDEERKLLH